MFTSSQVEKKILIERPLWLFVLYRIVLSATLLIVFIVHTSSPLGQFNRPLYLLVASFFFFLTMFSAFVMISRLFSLINQTLMMMFIDIGALTLLTYCSGGVQSGIGTLIAVTIAIGSVIISSYSSIALASIASSFILAQEIYLFQFFNDQAKITTAASLGAAYLAIAALAYFLSQRAGHSERRALINKQQLQKMSKLNAQIVQHMNTGVLVINYNTHVYLANKSALNFLNLKIHPGRIPLSYYSNDLMKIVEQWRAEGSIDGKKLKMVTRSAELLITFLDITSEDSGAILLLIEDAEQMVKQAHQLKLASLGRLTASIAHEIRNPLSSIGHAGQLLAESEALAATDERLLNIINSNVLRLNQVIENILQLSKTTAAEKTRTKINKFLITFIEQFKSSKSIKTDYIELQLLDPDIEMLLNLTQLQQVLTILCDNAVFHFNQSTVNLKIRLTVEINENGHLMIKVYDNGQTIDNALIEKIFEPFYSTAHTGTGLGLYVAKSLCEANDINLIYHQIPDGNCFALIFYTNQTS